MSGISSDSTFQIGGRSPSRVKQPARNIAERSDIRSQADPIDQRNENEHRQVGYVADELRTRVGGVGDLGSGKNRNVPTDSPSTATALLHKVMGRLSVARGGEGLSWPEASPRVTRDAKKRKLGRDAMLAARG